MTLCESFLGALSYEDQSPNFGGIRYGISYSTHIPQPMPRFVKSVTRTVLTRHTRARAGQTDESDIPTGEGCSRYPEEEP